MSANSSASELYYEEALAAVERRRASCDEILSALAHPPSTRTQRETALATAVNAVSAAVASVGHAPRLDAPHHDGAAVDAVSIAVRSVGAAIDNATSRADSAFSALAARSVDAEDAPGAPPPLPPVAASARWAPLSFTGWLGRNGEDEPPSVAASSSEGSEEVDHAPILSRLELNANDFVVRSRRIAEDARNGVVGSGQESEAQSAIRQARRQRLLGGSDVEEEGSGGEYDLDDAMRRFHARYEEYEESVPRIRSESGREIRMARSVAAESDDSDEEGLEASLERGARLRWHTASGDDDDDVSDDDGDRRVRVRDFATRISALERTLEERDGRGEGTSRGGRREEGDERPGAQRGEGRGFFQRLARGMAQAESDDSADDSHGDSVGFRARMDRVSAEIDAEIVDAAAAERDFGAGESDEEGVAEPNLTAADSLTPAEYRRGQLTNRAELIRRRVTTFLRIFRALREDVDSRFYSAVALQQRADSLVGELLSNVSEAELRCLGYRLEVLADMADEHLDAMQLSLSERYGYDIVRSLTTANANVSDGDSELNEIAQMERSSSSGDGNDDGAAVAEVDVLNLGESGTAEFSSATQNLAGGHGVEVGEAANFAFRARPPHLQAIAAVREARAIREVPSTGLRDVVESLRRAEDDLSQEMELSLQLAHAAEGFSLSASRTHFPWRPSPSDVESSSAEGTAHGRATDDLSALPPRLPRPARRTNEQPVAPSADLDNLSDLDGLSDDTLRTMASAFRRSSPRRATDSDSVAANDGRQSSFLGHDLSPSRAIVTAPVSKCTLELSIPRTDESAVEDGQSRKIVYCSERKVFSGSEWIVNVHVSSVQKGVCRAEVGSCARKRVAAIFLECCGPGPGAAQGSSSNSRWSAGEMCFSIAVSTAGGDGCDESEREYCHEFAGSGMESNDWGGRDFEVGCDESSVLVTMQVPKTVISMERTLMKIRREGNGVICQICMEGDVDQALVPCGSSVFFLFDSSILYPATND